MKRRAVFLRQLSFVFFIDSEITDWILLTVNYLNEFFETKFPKKIKSCWLRDRMTLIFDILASKFRHHLHGFLVQRAGDWAGPQPAQPVPSSLYEI